MTCWASGSGADALWARTLTQYRTTQGNTTRFSTVVINRRIKSAVWTEHKWNEVSVHKGRSKTLTMDMVKMGRRRSKLMFL
jgi:hypothetical protein